MDNIKQSVGWWCFVPQHFSAEQFVRTAAEAGFPALDLVPPTYWSLVRSHQLGISSVAGHQPLEVGLNRRELHARLEQEIRNTIDQAQRAEIPNVICFSGNRGEISDADGLAATAESLGRLAPFAEKAGVTLVLELLNSKVDHPDYQADRTAWGREVCTKVSSSRVKLLYDIYHMQIMEGDIIRTIEALHPLIGLYHTAGNPGRNDLDDDQELNYPAILTAIKQTGHSGYVAHEFLPKGEPAAALQAVFRGCALWL